MLLVDLHVIWLAVQPKLITGDAMEAIMNSGQDVAISTVTAWEFSQKRRKKPTEFPVALAELLAGPSIKGVDFLFACHQDAEDLPPIHADPFDRMLVAHARHLDCPLVTRDAAIHRYPVKTIW